jgi:DNA helicase II / ATP-dependent DNA helicase PcrA
MDAFEPVRQSAARLHEEAVAAGADPLNPMSVVTEVIKRLDLELCWLPADDPTLKGARALFDEQSGTICCEDTGDDAERAVLVAHEIGHVDLHSGSAACVAQDIDGSRSTEAAPVGLQRVEDYGVRERRELQANVFARELLFPRALARKLYIDERREVSAIVSQSGLSKNLIRQQLFDALLIAPLSEEGEAEPEAKQPHRNDESQDRAAAHRGSAFQLQAGPGTGKTRTLVKTVAGLLAEGVHPTAILILTYSNRAAGELSERISAASSADAASIWIGTFHAFGLDLVRRFHDRLNLPAEPKLFDRSDAIALLQEAVPTLPLVHYRNLWDPAITLREIIAAISRAKDELVGPAKYRELAEAMLREATSDEEQVAAEKCLEVAQIYEIYEDTLKKHGAVDFGDLIMRPALLLESDDVLRASVQLRHRHVLVDEYQDVNHASTRLLLWVVGDARQSIYRFRGASSANMAAFSQEYPAAKCDQLLINYRSTEPIVKVVTAIAPRMGASKGMLNLALEADRGGSLHRPQIRRYETLDAECEGIAASVRELEAGGVQLRQQAVLCRTNSRLNEIAQALEARGIPVLHLGSLFEREEIRDLLALLTLAIDRFGNGLARVGAMPQYDLSLQDVYLVTQWLQASERRALEALPDLANVADLSERGRDGLKRLAQDLTGIRPESTPWELLSTYLLERSDIVREISQGDSVSQWMRGVAIWQFLNFVREHPPASAGYPIRRLLDRVRNLVLFAEERDLRQVPAAALHVDAVRLLTVHGSKGLEFEAVHIPGLTVSSFPSSYRGQRCPPPAGMIADSSLSVDEEAKQSHKDEEECLFFVAVSRARTHCVLHLCCRMANGNKRNPSPYLGWIPAGLINEVPDPPRLPLPTGAPRPVPIDVIRPDGVHVTDGHLASYEKCPRRYFYTYVLGLGGAKEPTAFSQTHDCIYRLIEWLDEARRSGEAGLEAAEAAFDTIWAERGPTDHGFATEYRGLASTIIAALIKANAGRKLLDAEPIAIDLPNGRVVVTPNEMAALSDDVVILRRVRTGKKRSDEYDRLDYTLYHLAGQTKFGDAYSVEAVHLTDNLVERVTVTAQKMGNRVTKSGEMLAALNAGWFPPVVDAISCPRCPHFFICAAVCSGPLRLSEKSSI